GAARTGDIGSRSGHGAALAMRLGKELAQTGELPNDAAGIGARAHASGQKIEHVGAGNVFDTTPDAGEKARQVATIGSRCSRADAALGPQRIEKGVDEPFELAGDGVRPRT